MSDYSTVQERDAFDERIFEIVQEYLDDKESYQDEDNIENIGLSVNPEALELKIISRENNPEGWDFFPIEGLIRHNEDNTGDEPDCDATHELASSYIFVR